MTRWINKEKVLRRFRALPSTTRQHLETEFAGGAQEIVDMQRRLVPVGSSAPHLRDTIVWQWGFQARIKYAQGGSGAASGARRSGVMNIRITAGNSEVRYAHIVEHGAAPHVAGGIFKGAQHPGRAATPYFYPAYRAKRKRFKSRQRRALKKAVVASRGA